MVFPSACGKLHNQQAMPSLAQTKKASSLTSRWLLLKQEGSSATTTKQKQTTKALLQIAFSENFWNLQHAFSYSSGWRQHGAMYPVWRKTPLPHRNRRQKPLQPQKATAPNRHLVAAVKTPHPHKERKTVLEPQRGGLVRLWLSARFGRRSQSIF